MVLPALALAAFLSHPVQDHPDRQFDFWIGEWSVQNRHWQTDASGGTWRDGDVTRARITPVIDGHAILEEWAGPFHGSFMNGFSLRAWDPQAEKWTLLLFWTTDGDDAFGRLQGAFRHGRGEFFSRWNERGTEVTQRYTFSDALPDTVRWDSAVSRDGGDTWRTDWIMEFTRTRAAALTTEERLFSEPWTQGTLSPHEQARALDWMIGSWTGTERRAGDEREARLRCKLLNKDCLLLDSLEVRDDTGWDERLAVRGYVAKRGAWESWSVSEIDSRLRQALGSPGDETAVFEEVDPRTGSATRERLIRVDADRMRIEKEKRAAGETDYATVSVIELARER